MLRLARLDRVAVDERITIRTDSSSRRWWCATCYQRLAAKTAVQLADAGCVCVRTWMCAPVFDGDRRQRERSGEVRSAAADAWLGPPPRRPPWPGGNRRGTSSLQKKVAPCP